MADRLQTTMALGLFMDNFEKVMKQNSQTASSLLDLAKDDGKVNSDVIADTISSLNMKGMNMQYENTRKKTEEKAHVIDPKIKEEKALDNKIERYVIIDSRKSEIDWIKNNVVNSELNNLFDLNSIDWNECFRFACENNLVKTACEYKKNNPNMTYTEIGKMMGYERHSVKRWLEKGRKINWI